MWLRSIFSESGPSLETVDGVPSLEDLQTTVDGWIEPVDLWEDDRGRVSMWVNEEGLIRELPFTVCVTNRAYTDEPFIGFGTFAITRTDNMGNTVALTPEDVDAIHYCESFSFLRGGGVLPNLEVYPDSRIN